MKVKQNMGEAGIRSNRSRRTSSARTSLNEGEQERENKESVSMLDIPSLPQKVPSSPLLSPNDSEKKFPVDVNKIKREELTVDDSLRRSRRRERNKVAATKCRNKKKARTQILIRVLIFKLLIFGQDIMLK